MESRKILLNQSKIQRRENVTLIPGIDNLIADALGTIEVELVKFRTKVNRGESLNEREGKLLTLYIKSIIELSKEHRERAKAEDYSKLTNEELLQLVEQIKQKASDNAKS